MRNLALRCAHTSAQERYNKCAEPVWHWSRPRAPYVRTPLGGELWCEPPSMSSTRSGLVQRSAAHHLHARVSARVHDTRQARTAASDAAPWAASFSALA
eukprot:11252307-Alexandrium_andersonii.AAC.1